MSPAAALKAPLLDAAGKKTKDVSLEAAIFGAETKAHLVHEAVRAEQAAARQATRGGLRRGEVAGGSSKPWRQKGTGRARQGTIRAPHFTGGGMAFVPDNRNFTLKVNRKVKQAAFRGALSAHASAGTLALVDGAAFEKPSTRSAVALVAAWGQRTPLLVVATPEEEALIKSFRNIERTAVTVASELEVTELAWARSVLVSQAAFELVQARAGSGSSNGGEK